MRIFITVFVLGMATGCAIKAKYVVAEGLPTASAVIIADSDTTDVNGIYYNTFLMPDNRCPAIRKNSLGARLQAKNREEFPAVDIPAGAPVMIGVTYQDARFAQNRECGYQARFTPMAGEAYRLNFTTTRDGLSCGMEISDAAGNTVPHEAPAELCLPSLYPEATHANGVGHDVRYNVQIQSY